MKIFKITFNKYYHIVKIFSTREKMNNYYSKHYPFDKDFGDAYYLPLRKKSKLGELLFHKKSLSCNIIAEEIFHASLWQDRMTNKNRLCIYSEHFTEERLANIINNLTYKFYKQIKH